MMAVGGADADGERCARGSWVAVQDEHEGTCHPRAKTESSPAFRIAAVAEGLHTNPQVIFSRAFVVMLS